MFSLKLNFFPSLSTGVTETPQNGNGPKSEFGSVSFFFQVLFQELLEIPQKMNSVETDQQTENFKLF